MTAQHELETECAALSAFVSDLAVKVQAREQRAAELHARAAKCISHTIERGAELYSRERDLPKLLRREAWAELTDAEIIALLERSVAATSSALIRGHWAADQNRLVALRQALHAERT